MWRDGEMAAALVQMSLRFRGLLVVKSRLGGPGPLGGLWGQMRVISVEENPFYSKYRRRIEELRRADPAAFEARMEKRSEMTTWPPASSKQAEFARKVEERVESMSENVTRNKTLDSVLNLEIVQNKSAEEITQIWNEFFSRKDLVYAVIPGEMFDEIWRRAQGSPAFLYAVPRAEGYEFYVGQWSGREIHFTSLINIQSAGGGASSHLILYHYTELQRGKGIVLMNSQVDSRFLSVPEAQCLANQVQLFYASDAFHLVENFNHSPSSFKYMSVVSVLEENGLGALRA